MSADDALPTPEKDVTPHERAAWRAEAERQQGSPAVERILDRRILRLLDALDRAEARVTPPGGSDA